VDCLTILGMVWQGGEERLKEGRRGDWVWEDGGNDGVYTVHEDEVG